MSHYLQVKYKPFEVLPTLLTVETLQVMGTIMQSRPQLFNDNERERPAECALGSVIPERLHAPIHASTFHRAETEAATAFVVLNSGLELYADLIAREKERGEPAW